MAAGERMHARRWRSTAWRSHRLLAGLTIALALGAIACASASAGEWVQISCVNPDGSAADSQGWSTFSAGGGYGSNADANCGPGAPAFASLSSAAAVGVGSAETLHYTPPGGSTLNGGTVDVLLRADGGGYDASGTAVAYTPEMGYDASNVFFQCAAGLTPCAPGSNDYSGVLTLPGGRGGSLYLSAGCGGVAGQSCNQWGSDGAWSMVDLYSAQLRLSSASSPGASGIGGTLLTPGARAMSTLTFTASDPGPGVYSVAAEADGETLYEGSPDRNGGHCSPVGASAGALMFDASQPCKQTESVDLPIDTTRLTDGSHTLKVTVTDAAGNTSVVFDQAITTQNAPASTVSPAISETIPLAGQSVAAEPGVWSAPAGAGPVSYAYQWQDCDPQGTACTTIKGAHAASYTSTVGDVGHDLRVLVSAADNDGTSIVASPPSALIAAQLTPGIAAANGQPASLSAHLTVAGPSRVTRSFSDRALRLAGTLSGEDGRPIAGASLEILEQRRAGTPTVIAHAQSDAKGAFAATVPAGPSRRVTIAYRPYTGGRYAAQATVQENVTAAITLSVGPRRTAPGGTITLSGRVAGPLPARGVVVELLVHYRGAWVPFRDPRTSASGRFSVRYHFEGATGRFPFRAQVLGEQGGFPYQSGRSRTVDVQSG